MTVTQTEILVPPQPGVTNREPRFVGSKGGAGIAQWLISLMPAHRVYLEGCLGRGVIYNTKLPALENILIELDGATLTRFEQRLFESGTTSHYWPTCINGDCVAIVPTLNLPADALCYFDPPYPGDVRIDAGRAYYASDKRPGGTLTLEWHEAFLTMLQALPCMVMVSGYECELYSKLLDGWRTSYKWTVNRAGAKVKEFVWLNFQEPALLHDPRFVGGNYTDRQRVKRKMERWKKNFLALPPDERWAMYETLSSVVDVSQPEFME